MSSIKHPRSTVNLSQLTLSQLPTDTLSIESENDVLFRLLELLPEFYSSKNPKEQRIPEALICLIIKEARAIISKEPISIEVNSPVYVCGDLHGQFYDLINIFNLCPPLGGTCFGKPRLKKARVENDEEMYKFLFLGDYVDRGSRSIEVMVTLLALKIISPVHMTLLRGNHEDESIMKIYGFFDECKRRYSLRVFKLFSDLFRVLPITALVNDAIFCMHGGISSELTDISAIQDTRPLNVPHSGVICDLLWADPEPGLSDCDWAPSSRRISYVFSERALENFLRKNDIEFICRAHQVVEEGYAFFPDSSKRDLLTIFSATNYCNEFDNRGGVLKVDSKGVCSILVLKPPSYTQNYEICSFKDPVPSNEVDYGE